MNAILEFAVRRGGISRAGRAMAMIGIAAVFLPLSTIRLEAQEAGRARGATESAKPQDGQAVKPPIIIQGKPLSEWRQALKDRDPAVRKRAVEELWTVTQEEVGEQWRQLEIEIRGLMFNDKDADVRSAAAKVSDLLRVSSPQIRQQLLEEQRQTVAPTPTPLLLVDSQGRPVAGALVSTYFERNRDKELEFTIPRPLEGKTTDAQGEATLTLEIQGHLDGAGVYATRQQQGTDLPLVGVHSVSREEIGKQVRIVMEPACRVRFEVECPGFGELESKHNVKLDGKNFWRAAYVMLGNDNRAARPLFTHSTSGELEFLLPSGRYNLMIYGSEVKSVYRPIVITPGRRVQTLGVVDLSPSDAVLQGVFRNYNHWIQPDPRAELNGEAGDRKVLLRPLSGFGLKGDVRGTQHLAYSPDGKLLATAHWFNADPGEVKLWDALTGDLVATLPVPVEEGGVLNLAFSPDGKSLAGAVGLSSPKPPGVVVLWDVATRRALRTLGGHTARISALAFSPDGKTLASGGEDKSVRLWNVADGRENGRIEENPGWVRSLVFSANGNGLVIGSRKALRLWDVPGNRLRAMLEAEADGFWILSIELSPDGRMLAAGGSTVGPGGQILEAQVRLYDISQDPPARRKPLVFEVEGPAKPKRLFSSVAFSADGRRVVAVQMMTVVMWDAETGALVDYFEKSSGSSNDRVAASPDGRWLAITEMQRPRMIDITPPLAP